MPLPFVVYLFVVCWYCLFHLQFGRIFTRSVHFQCYWTDSVPCEEASCSSGWLGVYSLQSRHFDAGKSLSLSPSPLFFPSHLSLLLPLLQLIADKEEPCSSINQTVLLYHIFSLSHSVALFFSSPFPQTQQATEWEEFFQPALQDCILPYFMKTAGRQFHTINSK